MWSRSLLLFMLSLTDLPLVLAAAASSSLCSPGRSNPGLLASSPDIPVQGFCPRDVPVRVALLPAGTLFPGCPSPGSLRLSSCLFFLLDAPVQEAPLLCGFFLAPDVPVCGTGSTPPDDPVRGLCTTLPWMFQSGALYYSSLSTLAGGGGVCASLFFRAPSAAPLPPLLPALLCVPSCSPPVAFLSVSLPSTPRFPSLPRSPPSLPSAPFSSLCGGFAGARTQAPSLYVCMLLCFGAGTHAQTRFCGFLLCSLFFPAFSLFSCIAICFNACPPVPSSFPSSHALPGALGRALVFLYSMLAPFGMFVLSGSLVPSPFARTFCLFGARTQAPLPTNALCQLPVPCSLVPLVHVPP